MGAAQIEKLVSPGVGVEGFRVVFIEEKIFEPHGSVAGSGQRRNGKYKKEEEQDGEGEEGK